MLRWCMKLKTLTRTYLWEKAGFTGQPPAINDGQIWTPVMIMPASGQADKSHLLRSLVGKVDGQKKRYVSAMLDALFRAVCVEDFAAFFNNSIITYKKAHSFKHQRSNEILRELKHGKKDRIYLYPYSSAHGKFIFILQYDHKDQMPTSDEVKSYAESAIKDILATTEFKLEK